MSGPIETKVKVATVGAYLGSTGLLAGLTAVEDQPSLVSVLPGWLAPFVLSAIPTAITFVAAYRARHTPRSDADARAASDTKGV
ncbi:holin [Kitasatospora sp. NPDC004272]